MVTLLIYFVLIVFWLENCVGVGVLGKGFSLKNLSLYLLLFVWGLTFKTRDTLFQKNNLNRYLLILMVMIAVSIFSNVYGSGPQKTSWMQEIVSYKETITPWLFFFIITALISDKRTCERSISGLILFLLATVFAMLIENYIGIDLGTQPQKSSAFGRSAGFADVNEYAAFLVLFLPLFLSSIFFQERRSKKIKGCFIFLLGIIALVSTVSKGGFIAFFVSLGYFFNIVIRKRMFDIRKVILLLSLLFTFGVASYLVLPSQTKEVAKKRVTLQEEYNPWSTQSWVWRLTSGRTGVWMHSLKLIAQRPIFGYGNGACENQLKLSTHSDPLKWLVNHGIIGFSLFTLIYIQIYRHVSYHFKTSANPQSRLLYLSYICGFIGYVVAMSGVNIYKPQLIFWIYTAIIYKHTQLDAIRE